MRGESLQAPLGDIAGLGPDHPNTVSIIVKRNIHKTNLSANTDHLSCIVPVCKYLKKLPFSSSYQNALQEKLGRDGSPSHFTQRLQCRPTAHHAGHRYSHGRSGISHGHARVLTLFLWHSRVAGGGGDLCAGDG